MAKVLITIEAEVDDNLTLPTSTGQYELPITASHAELIDCILLQEIIWPKSSIGTITWTTVE